MAQSKVRNWPHFTVLKLSPRNLHRIAYIAHGRLAKKCQLQLYCGLIGDTCSLRITPLRSLHE